MTRKDFITDSFFGVVIFCIYTILWGSAATIGDRLLEFVAFMAGWFLLDGIKRLWRK